MILVLFVIADHGKFEGQLLASLGKRVIAPLGDQHEDRQRDASQRAGKLEKHKRWRINCKA